ncbi:MAG: hypothetical protein QM775_15405 [Pirellulales bacterium]
MRARKPRCEECLLATFCPKIGVAKGPQNAKAGAAQKVARERKNKSTAVAAGKSPQRAKGSRR